MKQVLAIALLLICCACRKDKTVTVDALVVDEGINIPDGCGWHIIAGGIDYIPDNLSHEFETDSLPVRVTFTSADSAGCGLTANLKTHPLMNIKSIKKR